MTKLGEFVRIDAAGKAGPSASLRMMGLFMVAGAWSLCGEEGADSWSIKMQQADDAFPCTEKAD
jgi:hypothetical protein